MSYKPWQLNIGEYPADGKFREKMEFISRFGLLAPSVHNTQPWRYYFENNYLEITPDNDRILTHGDPTGRECWISIGCCVQAIVQAAEAYGLTTKVTADEGVKIEFLEKAGIKNLKALHAIIDRASDRSLFSPARSKVLDLSDVWTSETTKITVSDDKNLIKKVADLSSKCIALALSIPEFRRELSECIRTNFTKKPDGMPGFVFGKGLFGSIFNIVRYRFLDVSGSESENEKQKIVSATWLVFILTSGDTKEFWLEAGRAYMAACIKITHLGYAHSTSAAVVEAPEFHKEIETALNTNYRLQAVIRVGTSGKKPLHSPRRELNEVTSTA